MSPKQPSLSLSSLRLSLPSPSSHSSTSTLPSSRRSFGIRSITRPNPSTRQTTHKPTSNLPTLQSTPAAALQKLLRHDALPLRTGALATKKGMTALYDPETGVRTACTVLQLDRVQVVSHKTARKHGYSAVCIGYGLRAAKNVGKPMRGHYSVQGVAPKQRIREFRVRDHRGLAVTPVGMEITADWFSVGNFVDTRSDAKGKGFQGVMKRWGMKGQGASHGVSLTHRSMGSAGQGQGGGSRVYPGKKMAGRMGGERNTIQNLKVLAVDEEKGIVVVNGPVSGAKGSMVMIQDARKKPWPELPPIPGKHQTKPDVEDTLESQPLTSGEEATPIPTPAS